MRKRLLAILLILLLPGGRAWAASDDFSAVFLDVGAGDCILMRQGDVAWLVDTGPVNAWAEVETQLTSLGVRRLDRLVLTHMHPDHAGNLQGLLSRFAVGEVWISAGVKETEAAGVVGALQASGVPFRRVSRGETAALGGAAVTVLSPWPDAVYDKQNDASIMMTVAFAGRTLLLEGDAERDAEMTVYAARSELPIRADVLKVGHHGMTTSTAYPYAMAVGAMWAVCSCGDGTENASLQKQTVETLRLAGAEAIAWTAGNGPVTLQVSSTGEMQMAGSLYP